MVDGLLGLLDVCDFLLLSCMIYELLVLDYTIASQHKAAVSQRFFLIYSLSFEYVAPSAYLYQSEASFEGHSRIALSPNVDVDWDACKGTLEGTATGLTLLYSLTTQRCSHRCRTIRLSSSGM
jgi:hypothetical protein